MPSTAQLVKQLRDATGAPMMECKKALASPGVGGDVTRATEWLRKHGSAKVLSKVAGREALEGLVGIKVMSGGMETGSSNAVASVVRVSSETDFAARSDALSSFVQEVADAAAAYARVEDLVEDLEDAFGATASKTTTVEDVRGFLRRSGNMSPDGTATSLEDRLGDAVLAIRENLTVDSITILRASTPHSVFGGYVHGRASPASTCGTSASIVELVPIAGAGGGGANTVVVDGTRASEAARRLAMHVVAARPAYLDASSVPSDVVEKEREILAEKAKADGGGGKTTRPPDIVEKIVSGQMRKFYEGACLTEQAHMVEEGGPKVSKALADLGLEVRSFVLVGMGK
jgi:elongation factor Ts